MLNNAHYSFPHLRSLQVVLHNPGELKPYRSNARSHSKKQIQQIAKSIKTFGFTNPLLIDREGIIITGHGRLEAAMLLGMDKVPTILIDNMSEAQIKAYRIADNKLAEQADWDKEILTIEFQELQAMDLDFDLEVTGFEMPEIDLMIQDLAPEPDPLDELPEVDEQAPVISCRGDLWLLGEHRLLCADALLEENHAQLMASTQASMVITDPPYNVPIDGHVGGLGAIRHAEFAMATGEMSPEEFITFLATVFALLGLHGLPGALHYVFMDWRHMDEVLAAGKAVYTVLKNLCVWNKNNGGMGSMYRSKHELVFVFKHGKEPHINNVQLGRYGRYRTNVWDYPGVNTFREGRMDELKAHPTVKPVALVADAILDASNRGDLILDAFGGSGTTIIAAERTGRCARVIEIEPRYVDVSIRRWQEITGGTAVHAESGMSFDAVSNQRLITASTCVVDTQEGVQRDV